jgi:DNA-binding transcriptional ArsR family regulator
MLLVTYYSVIGNEATYRIGLLLSRYALSVTELCRALKLSQPHVSHKLARLREHGYVNNTREGKRVIYRFKEPWRSILLHGDINWHKLNPEYASEGRADLKRLEEILNGELTSREIHPVISGPPTPATAVMGHPGREMN